MANSIALGRHCASRSIGQHLLRTHRGADLCFTIILCRARFSTALIVEFWQSAAEQRDHAIAGRHIFCAGVHTVPRRLAADER